MIAYDNISRFELIDHTGGAVDHYPGTPRTLHAKDVHVVVAIQDDGRTLKVFLSKEPHVRE